MKNYIVENQKKLNSEQKEFYSINNTHVYIKNKIVSPNGTKINIKNVVAKIEEIIPAHLLMYVEFILVGWFEEFEKRDINSFYQDGTLYISNFQDNEDDMIDDIVHEIAHSLETPLGREIYGDGKIEQEFIGKRTTLYRIIEEEGYDVNIVDFLNTEYNEELDNFLHKTVGYERLSNYIAGLMISPYSATSIREYFAEVFQEFYLRPELDFTQRISPAAHEKITELHVGFFLDEQ
tara:strand:+ start:2950 stop:3654 length:705 start_codon:yes stop_codon:yes gene_type:complete